MEEISNALEEFAPRSERDEVYRQDFLALHSTGSFTRSTNPFCHFVVDAFIVDEGRENTLLIGHRMSGELVFPGGHLEPNETLLDGALREVTEETGASKNDLSEGLLMELAVGFVPLEISWQRKLSPHLHYHICYLFFATKSFRLATEDNGVTSIGWYPLGAVENSGLRSFHHSRLKLYDEMMTKGS